MRIENGVLSRVENKDLNKDGSFVVPNSVTSIGDYAFEDCRRLTRITIPYSVEGIGNWAFYSCSGYFSFCRCSSLTRIILPDSVTSIGSSAFCGCKGLITKKSIYKAFKITKSGKLRCKNKIYTPNKWHTVRGDLELCKKGIHYCTNLFEIFDYYYGELDEDIAIYECEIKGEDLQKKDSSKHCCKWLKPIKRLSKEDIIDLLNGKE